MMATVTSSISFWCFEGWSSALLFRSYKQQECRVDLQTVWFRYLIISERLDCENILLCFKFTIQRLRQSLHADEHKWICVGGQCVQVSCWSNVVVIKKKDAFIHFLQSIISSAIKCCSWTIFVHSAVFTHRSMTTGRCDDTVLTMFGPCVRTVGI